MTVSTNMSQWLSEAGRWAGQVSGMKWRFSCCCFLQTGVPSPAVFSSCCLLPLYTASKTTFRSAAPAFSCWVYDGHGVGNVHSILPNYFTDLFTVPIMSNGKLQLLSTDSASDTDHPDWRTCLPKAAEQSHLITGHSATQRLPYAAMRSGSLHNSQYSGCNAAWEVSEFRLVISGKRYCSIHLPTTTV